MVHSGKGRKSQQSTSRNNDVDVSGSKVEKFVMSVIKAASGGVSPCPNCSNSPNIVSYTSPPPKRLSPQSSQEVVEETLGSLANLITSSSSGTETNSNSPTGKSPFNPTFVAASFTKTLKSRAANGKRVDHPAPASRHNMLMRKQSSLKALTPQDLGRVRKSVASGNEFEEISLNTTDNKSTEPNNSQDHLSSFHLRKPISRYQQTEESDNDADTNTKYILTGNRRSNESNNTLSANNNHCQLEEAYEKEEKAHSNSFEKDTISKQKQYSHHRQSARKCHLCQRHLSILHYHHHHSHHHHYHYFQPHCCPEVEYYYDDYNCDEESPRVAACNLGDDGYLKNSTSSANYGHMRKSSEEQKEEEQERMESPKCCNHLQDMSFYRKFSATSPITRSKSSLSRDAPSNAPADLNSWTKGKKQKSRSTPIKLDIISGPVAFPLIDPISIMHYGSTEGNVSSLECGGCLYCSRNELSCNCCCDECCCARQSSQMLRNISRSREKGEIRESRESGCKSRDASTAAVKTIFNTSRIGESNFPTIPSSSLEEEIQLRKFSEENRSRSLDTLMNNWDLKRDKNYHGFKIDDEIVNDPGRFIDTHLFLRHLNISDNSEEEEEEEEKEEADEYENRNGEALLNDDDEAQSQTASSFQIVRKKYSETAIKDEVEFSRGNVLNKNKVDEITDKVANDNNDDDDGFDNTAHHGGIIREIGDDEGEIVEPTNVTILRNTSAGMSSSQRNGNQKRNRNSSSLRIANGEIRSSPTSMAMSAVRTTAIFTPQQQNNYDRIDDAEEDDNISSVDSSGRRRVAGSSSATAATMTVTVESMSLFLDAVHVKLSQED